MATAAPTRRAERDSTSESDGPADLGPTRPGPRRPPGAPVGPDAVRRAVLDAAGQLFAERGIAAVSLRDIAAAADVQLGLIARYIGSRDDLVHAVFEDLSRTVAADVADAQLGPQSFEPGTPSWRWSRVLVGMLLAGDGLPDLEAFNPVSVVATIAVEHFGVDERSARIRAAQILASAVGWRLLEAYLVEAGSLGDEDPAELRAQLNVLHLQIGALPYPGTPPVGDASVGGAAS